ncbi:MAG: hypothetical protein ACKVS6_11935 [Planctomycetota bacterium]
MSPRAIDRLTLLLLALIAMAAVAGALRPGHTFAAIHSALRKPFDAGIPANDLKAIANSNNYETGDQLFQVLPERRAFNDALSRGELPLWWPEAGGGISLIGAPGAELLEPRALILSYLFGNVESLGIQAALTIFTLAALTYLWLRLRGLSPIASAFGSVAFALGGTATSNLYYICKVDAMVLLPGGLAALELWFRNRKILSFLLLTFCAADSALASFPQSTAAAIYGLLFVGAFRMFEYAREKGAGDAIRSSLTLLFALAIGLGAAAVHLLPVAEWMQQSGRPESLGGLGFRSTPANWLSMIAPLVLGNPASSLAMEGGNAVPDLLPWICDPEGRYNFTETTMYAGIISLPFFFAGLFRGKTVAPAIISLAFLLAVAAGTPAALLPGVSVGAPSRALAGASFFVAWLAAEGVDALFTIRRVRIAGVIGTVVLLLIGFGAIYIRHTPAAQPETIADRAYNARSSGKGETKESVPKPEVLSKITKRWQTEVQPEFEYLAFLAFASVFGIGLALGAPKAKVVIFVILAGDLLLFSHKILPSQPTHHYLSETPAVREIRRAAAGGRIARVAPTDFPADEDWQLFQTTIPSYFGIHDTAAYVVFPNQTQVDVAAAMFPLSVFEGTYLGAFPKIALDSIIMDLFGVSVVVSRERIERADLEAVVQRFGFFAYKRKIALGRAWIAPAAKHVSSDAELLKIGMSPEFHPAKLAILEGKNVELGPAGSGGGKITIEDISNREVLFKIRGTGGGYFTESAHACAGWTATLNGFPAKLYRANRYGRSVYVPPGDHEIRFTYLPRSFVLGSFISIICILLIPFGAYRLWRGRWIL